MHPLANEARVIASFLVDATPEDKLPLVDAIFAFGHSGSIATPEHASRLYLKGLAPRLIVTGSTGFRGVVLPLGFETQADLFADVAIKSGVPSSAIIRDRESRHTLDNVRLGMAAAHKAGLTIRSLILCAIPVHLRRCRATFARQFPAVVTYGSAFVWDETSWLNDYRIGRLVGEIDRLSKYVEKGDTVPVAVPTEVAEACEIIRGRLTVV